jgi:hypothetical protein
MRNGCATVVNCHIPSTVHSAFNLLIMLRIQIVQCVTYTTLTLFSLCCVLLLTQICKRKADRLAAQQQQQQQQQGSQTQSTADASTDTANASNTSGGAMTSSSDNSTAIAKNNSDNDNNDNDSSSYLGFRET